MVTSREQYAQKIFIATLQACKGTCKCNVCKLMRQAADAMQEQALNPSSGSVVNPLSLIPDLEAMGYKVTGPGQPEEEL